jgi:hypothetical protein
MKANASARMPVGGVLTPRMERMIRLGSIGSAIIIAISAMVLSYAGLHDLALDAEIHPRFALLVPIMVDGLQFVGSLGVVYSTLSGLRSWYPWLLMLMGVSVSAWGNWQAAPDQMTAKLLHAAAPIILALVLEELLRVMRHKVHLHAEREAASAMAAEDEHTKSPAAEQDVPVVAQAATTVQPVAEVEPSLTAVAEPFARVEAPAPQPTVAPPAAIAGAPEGAPEPAPEDGALDAERATQPAEDAIAVETPVAESGPVTEVPRAAEPTTDAAAHPAAHPAAQPASQSDQPGAFQPAATAVAEPATEKAVEPVKAVEPRPAQSGDVLPPYPADATYKEQVRAMLEQDPSLNGGTIARIMGKDASNTRKIVREWRAEVDVAAAADRAAPNGGVPERVTASATRETAPAAQPASQPRPTAPASVAPASVPEVVDFTAADPFGTSMPVGAGR